MGTYGVSTKELIERLVDCLDNTEGDFDSESLMDALDFLRFYAPTSDTSKQFEKMWRYKLKKLDGAKA